MDIKRFWHIVFNAKNAGGDLKFPNLSKIICILLSFPFSNASVERIFSQLKLIKTEHRTALKHESLLGLLTTKLAFQQKGNHQAANLDPQKDMLSLYSKMLSNAGNTESADLRLAYLESVRNLPNH